MEFACNVCIDSAAELPAHLKQKALQYAIDFGHIGELNTKPLNKAIMDFHKDSKLQSKENEERRRAQEHLEFVRSREATWETQQAKAREELAAKQVLNKHASMLFRPAVRKAATKDEPCLLHAGGDSPYQHGIGRLDIKYTELAFADLGKIMWKC